MSNQHDEPVTITTARPSRSADIRRREVRYLLSMAIRTLCFVLAVVTSGALRWSLVAAAVFLPYVAVVLANATDRRGARESPGLFHDQKRQIESRNRISDEHQGQDLDPVDEGV